MIISIHIILNLANCRMLKQKTIAIKHFYPEMKIEFVVCWVRGESDGDMLGLTCYISTRIT